MQKKSIILIYEIDSEETSHGTAAQMFIICDNVDVKHYREQPAIKKLDDNGNLKHTIDFRSVYPSVLPQCFN